MNNNYWTLAQHSLNSHPSMGLTTNFVLAAEPSSKTAAIVLYQYLWLPRMIVDFLTRGAERLRKFPAVYGELRRNRAEELGSRTHGKVHYDILCDGLRNEAGVDTTIPVPCLPATKTFLDIVGEILNAGSEANVAGAIYALEASAVPELLVVAALINRFRPNTIDLDAMQYAESIRTIRDAADYTLHDFFVLHIQDFERGHESGLRTHLGREFPEEFWPDFYYSYEKVLVAMDDWWLALSQL